MQKPLRALGIAAAIASGRRPALPPADPAMVAEWMQNYYGPVRAERLSPPVTPIQTPPHPGTAVGGAARAMVARMKERS